MVNWQQLDQREAALLTEPCMPAAGIELHNNKRYGGNQHHPCL